MVDNKVIQIMGPGCGNKEVEHCPPTYHLELSHEELARFIGNPTEASVRLKLKANFDSVMVSVPDKFAVSAQTIYCCVSCLSSSLCCQAWPQ